MPITVTGNADADHLVTLHQRIRDATCTGTLDRKAVETALDEADKLIRDKFGAKKAEPVKPALATAPKTFPATEAPKPVSPPDSHA